MTSLALDINIINPALHEHYFNYLGDFGTGAGYNGSGHSF